MNSKLLYVDVEWNQMGKRLGPADEILELAAISSIDEYTVSRYFKYIKPNKLVKKNTFYFLGITPRELRHGEQIENVMSAFCKLWNDSDCVVIWSNDALNIIKSICTRRNISLKDVKIIILQNLICKMIDNPEGVSFEKTLLKFGALYDRTRMHNAEFDAECLKSLFDILCDKYKKACFNEDGQTLIGSIRSSIVHRSDCGYVKKISETNCEKISVYKVFLGARCCKKCIPDEISIEIEVKDTDEYDKYKVARTLKGKKVNFEQIGLLIDYFQLRCDYHSNYILVLTTYSSWKVFYDNGYVTKLEHENYKYKAGKGYHDQNISIKDLYSVLEYIVNHDSKPYKKSKEVEWEKTLNREAKKKKKQKERRVYDDEWKDLKRMY